MKKEITKGTQKFIWHMAAFVAVFVLALVVINKFIPEPTRTAEPNTSRQTASVQEDSLPQGDDFDSVKARGDAANQATGQEVKSLYSGEGKTIAQKQAESRLFFSNLKNALFCILLIVLIIVLIKKGFNLKKLKGMFTDGEDEEKAPTDPLAEDPKVDEQPALKQPEPKSEDPESVPSTSSEEEEEPPLDEEPGFDEGASSEDEQEVAENCKF